MHEDVSDETRKRVRIARVDGKPRDLEIASMDGEIAIAHVGRIAPLPCALRGDQQ